jgi:hypothetical protein
VSSPLAKYEGLPMLMTPSECARAIDDLWADVAANPDVAPLEVAQALSVMIARQSSNYLPFDVSIAARIEGWAVSVWSEDDVELFDVLALLVVNTDTGKGRALLQQALHSKEPRIRALAQSALQELQN